MPRFHDSLLMSSSQTGVEFSLQCGHPSRWQRHRTHETRAYPISQSECQVKQIDQMRKMGFEARTLCGTLDWSWLKLMCFNMFHCASLCFCFLIFAIKIPSGASTAHVACISEYVFSFSLIWAVEPSAGSIRFAHPWEVARSPGGPKLIRPKNGFACCFSLDALLYNSLQLYFNSIEFSSTPSDLIQRRSMWFLFNQIQLGWVQCSSVWEPTEFWNRRHFFASLLPKTLIHSLVVRLGLQDWSKQSL